MREIVAFLRRGVGEGTVRTLCGGTPLPFASRCSDRRGGCRSDHRGSEGRRDFLLRQSLDLELHDHRVAHNARKAHRERHRLTRGCHRHIKRLRRAARLHEPHLGPRHDALIGQRRRRERRPQAAKLR
eukprot:7388126-Prymnesium_polylepis.2